MINLPTIKMFALKFGLMMLLFFIGGTNLNSEQKITEAYANKSNTLFKNLAAQKKVKVKRVKNQPWTIKIDIVNVKVGKKNWCTLNIWGIFYLPFTLYLSLIIATPFKKWFQKFSSIAVSLLFLFGYFYACIRLKITHLFHSIDKTAPNFSNNIYYDVVDKVNIGLIDNINTYLLISLIIWFLIVAQNADFSTKDTNKQH